MKQILKYDVCEECEPQPVGTKGKTTCDMCNYGKLKHKHKELKKEVKKLRYDLKVFDGIIRVSN